MVCVLLGILVGVVVPRFTNVDGRRAEASVRECVDLLSSAATRDQLTGQGVAIEYDRDLGRLRLFVPELKESGSAGASRASGDVVAWRADPLSRPVELDSVEIVGATQDFEELDSTRWRVEFPRTEPRPRLVLTLQQLGDQKQWAIVLSPNGTRAVVVEPELAAQDADSIDLDISGKATSAW